MTKKEKKGGFFTVKKPAVLLKGSARVSEEERGLQSTF